MMDMVIRKRRVGKIAVHGERQWKAKFKDDDVRHIRSIGMSAKDVSLKYGVSYKRAWAVVKGKTWRHI